MISKRLEELTKKNSAIREMFEEGNRLSKIYGRENVFDYSLGNPIVETPNSVRESIQEILKNDDSFYVHGYMPNSGFVEVRNSISQDLNDRFGTNFTANNIVMTVGAAGGLNCVLQTLLNPEDEVIIISPFFVEYVNYIKNWGGKPVIVESEPKTFNLNVENIVAAITNKTKALIINNPNNPTGVMYDKDSLEKLGEELKIIEGKLGNPIYIISDEPYRELAYDGKVTPFIPRLYNDTIVVYSWSKSLSIPGERIGYIAINPSASDSELIFHAASISNRIIGFVNAPSLIQLMIKDCLKSKVDIDFYDQNRKILYKELTRIGYECVYPQGAFYLWVKAPIIEKDFIEIAKKHKLLLVPGSSFYGSGYIRIAYCVSKEQVEKSIKVFEEVYNEACQK